MKNKVLIFGVAGFTGKHFSDYISKNSLSKKFEFLGVDICVAKTLCFPTKEVDLSIFSNVKSLLLDEKPDYIINLIGTFTSNDFVQLLKINVGISQNILFCCSNEKNSVKNILFLGSAAEYGSCSNLPIIEDQKSSPISMYGLSKAFQTETALYYFHNYNVNVTIARPFNLLGKGLAKELSIGSFVNQIREIGNKGSISVGNVFTRRDFIDISDAIDAYWKLLLYGRPGEIYNVCAGYSHSIKDILDKLVKISGKKIDLIVKDEFIKKNDIKDSYGNNSKLKELFEWEIKVSIEESLLKML